MQRLCSAYSKSESWTFPEEPILPTDLLTQHVPKRTQPCLFELNQKVSQKRKVKRELEYWQFRVFLFRNQSLNYAPSGNKTGGLFHGIFFETVAPLHTQLQLQKIWQPFSLL